MPNQNSGHGHVYPRPDGVKARCGGPGLCTQCSAEFAQQRKDVTMPRELNGTDDLNKLFSYQPPTPGMQEHFTAVSQACEAAARVICEHVPASADRTLAIQHLVDARMRANAAIALDGQRLIPMN